MRARRRPREVDYVIDGDDNSVPHANGTASRPGTDIVVLDCILANTREMKKLAIKAGFSRVALILEMAELEAADQLPKLRGLNR